MKKLNIKGFTLIEMLVVVLIIGILAGVALPQYKKAVEKTHLAEALLTISSLQKSVDIYILSKGWPTGNSVVRFLNDNPNDLLDVDFTQNLECSSGEYGSCCSKYFCYTASCGNIACYVSATRTLGSEYSVTLSLYKSSRNWGKDCQYGLEWEWLCKYLESEGFDRQEC